MLPHTLPSPGTHSHLSLPELLAMAADLAKSLTGSEALTRRTRGMVTLGRFTGTTRGTGDTRPRYSKILRGRNGRSHEGPGRPCPSPSPHSVPGDWGHPMPPHRRGWTQISLAQISPPLAHKAPGAAASPVVEVVSVIVVIEVVATAETERAPGAN